MRTRPSFIQEVDYKLLIEKYGTGKKLDRIIKKIENDYPIQYAIGYVDFLNCKILVNKWVLVPRFETELFVHKLIEYIKKEELSKDTILDLCTGSGCIAVSLKKELPDSLVIGIDKSIMALKMASKNARLNKTNVKFARKNVLKSIHFPHKFSVLVSNPPYVKLNEEVSSNTRYEPKMALYPGEDDIIFYKKILDNSKTLLYKKNIIAFEIGSTQATRICSYAKKIYPNSKIEVQKDYNGYDRFIFIFNE